MSTSNKVEDLEKLIQELKKINSELIAKNSLLDQENKRLALRLEVDNLVDGVVSHK
jgi:regulator of replication initiation timing